MQIYLPLLPRLCRAAANKDQRVCGRRRTWGAVNLRKPKVVEEKRALAAVDYKHVLVQGSLLEELVADEAE